MFFMYFLSFYDIFMISWSFSNFADLRVCQEDLVKQDHGLDVIKKGGGANINEEGKPLEAKLHASAGALAATDQRICHQKEESLHSLIRIAVGP